MAVVDGRVEIAGPGLRGDLARLKDPAEERHAVEVEAELSRDVRRCPEQRHQPQHDPRQVACTRRPHRLRPPAPRRPDGEQDRERDPGDRPDVRPLRVQVARRLDEAHGGAEGEGDDRENARAPVIEPVGHDRQHRERGECGREADEDERAARSADEAGVVHFPELLRRDPPVRLEDCDGREPVERPHDPDLRQARPLRPCVDRR